jgi:hypothetical protein
MSVLPDVRYDLRDDTQNPGGLLTAATTAALLPAGRVTRTSPVDVMRSE